MSMNTAEAFELLARQCIKLLPVMAKNKPELKEDILSALHRADVSFL